MRLRREESGVPYLDLPLLVSLPGSEILLVADPGFPKVGTPTPQNLLFCVKMKEF